jgi:hypothetical protein
VPIKDLRSWLAESIVKSKKNSRDDKCQHDQQVLASLLDEPRRAQQHDDDIKTKNHCKKLGLKNREVEAGDNDVGESSKAACWQSSEHCDATVAPSLRVLESLYHLLSLELLVLETGLVRADSFDHEVLVFFSKALCSHGRVGHPPANEEAPEDGNPTVSDEESLPRFERSRVEECETIGQETSDNLLSAVHHVPGYR